MFKVDDYGKVLNFSVYPSAKFGDIFQNVTLLSVVDYDTAKLFADVDSLGVNVYPTLPLGSPKDYTKYTYAKIQFPNGTVTVLATPWINFDTVVTVTNLNITAVVSANHATDLDTIRKMLLANNFTIVSLGITQ